MLFLRRWALLPVLSLAAASMACDGPQDTTIDIVFDPCAGVVVVPAADASESERGSIATALGFWNDLAATRLTLADAPGEPRIPVNFEDAAPAFYGLYQDELGVVLINRELTDPHARAVTVAHELGHSFGLLHPDPDDGPAVMISGNLTVEPNERDERALEALWGACADRPHAVRIDPVDLY